MTQAEANLIYTENTCGVYKYECKYIDVVKEIINFSDKFPDVVCLGHYPNTKYHDMDRKLFDLNNLIIYLYYHERHIDLDNEITNNYMLNDYWYDSDSYDLSDEQIMEMKDNTPKTKELLRKIFEMNNEFEKLVYN